jgi:hypothetical protein
MFNFKLLVLLVVSFCCFSQEKPAPVFDANIVRWMLCVPAAGGSLDCRDNEGNRIPFVVQADPHVYALLSLYERIIESQRKLIDEFMKDLRKEADKSSARKRR